ncbi:MAG: hypothetical protein U0U70_17190 [Chitinophagaceae bacterium]
MKTLFIILSIMIFFTRCGLEVNSVDSQASSSLQMSIDDKLFLQEYTVKDLPTDLFTVKEAWAEYVWKNKVDSNGKVTKMKTGGLQINLKCDGFMNKEFKSDKYLFDWEMLDGDKNYFGKSNGVYILFLKGEELPDKINMSVNKVENDSSKNIYHFLIQKKKSSKLSCRMYSFL